MRRARGRLSAAMRAVIIAFADMTEPRLKTEIRVAAQLRRAQGAGAFATVARRGDPDAGAVAVKVYLGGARARVLIQSRDLDGHAVWRDPLAPESETGDQPAEYPEAEADAWLAKETSVDPDLWIVEIEDRKGRAFVEEE